MRYFNTVMDYIAERPLLVAIVASAGGAIVFTLMMCGLGQCK